MTFRRQFATTIRRYPALFYIPNYVYRFFQTKYSLGVVGVVFNEKEEVLLVEHLFHAQLPWGLPGGWMDHNEDPADAVTREYREELGLQITIDALVATQRTGHNHLDVAFLCTAQNSVQALSSELLDYKWIAIDDLPPMRKFHYDTIIKAHAILQNR